MSWREDAHFGKGRFDQIMSRRAPGCDWTRIDKKLLSLCSGNYFFEDFKNLPVGNLTTGAAAAGATGNENFIQIGGSVFHQHILGTQDIILPLRTATGLNVSHDQTEDDGIEYTNGIAIGAAKRVFTIGTDKAFFFRLKFTIANVSGTDGCAMGFRKAEAFQAAIGSYDEMASLNVISGDIKTDNIINTVETITDTTDNWADGETHTLQVNVSGAGVVTFLIDGAAPTVTAAFTFDDGEVVIPFFYFIQAAAPVAGVVNLLEWEWGFQGQVA
jgi:hypothetical protein